MFRVVIVLLSVGRLVEYFYVKGCSWGLRGRVCRVRSLGVVWVLSLWFVFLVFGMLFCFKFV